MRRCCGEHLTVQSEQTRPEMTTGETNQIVPCERTGRDHQQSEFGKLHKLGNRLRTSQTLPRIQKKTKIALLEERMISTVLQWCFYHENILKSKGSLLESTVPLRTKKVFTKMFFTRGKKSSFETCSLEGSLENPKRTQLTKTCSVF